MVHPAPALTDLGTNWKTDGAWPPGKKAPLLPLRIPAPTAQDMALVPQDATVPPSRKPAKLADALTSYPIFSA